MELMEDEIYIYHQGINPKKIDPYNLIKPIDINKNYGKNILKFKTEECSICLESLINNCKKKIVNTENFCFIQLFNCCNIFDDESSIINKKNESQKICIISCYHIFHSECIIEWLKKEYSCPICRKKINIIK
jgi:hypothetical protein